LELRSALEKGTSIKDASGGAASSASQTAGFGIGSFLSSDGTVGQEYSVPASQNNEALLSRKMEIGSPSTITPSKTCKECRAKLPIRAKFCGTCGNNQENDLR
jgi:ribosomal protein L40E